MRICSRLQKLFPYGFKSQSNAHWTYLLGLNCGKTFTRVREELTLSYCSIESFGVFVASLWMFATLAHCWRYLPRPDHQ